MKREPIYFEPVKNPRAGSYIALAIRPPGTWFDNRDFKVFVGGCGRGKSISLAGAKRLLLKLAIEECDQRLANLRVELGHYERERQRLTKRGLGRVKR